MTPEKQNVSSQSPPTSTVDRQSEPYNLQLCSIIRGIRNAAQNIKFSNVNN